MNLNFIYFFTYKYEIAHKGSEYINLGSLNFKKIINLTKLT